MTTRVLLVDDHGPSREHLRAIVAATRTCTIVGEADNGVDGLERTLTLAPDITLMDVELPGLNGIDAVRRIRAAGARTKVVVVSGHPSSDVAEAAFAAGAVGYVVKLDAVHDLPAAIDSARRGAHFVGATFSGFVPSDARPRPPRSHRATFHSDAASLVDELAAFADAYLRGGRSAILLTHPARRPLLEQTLRGRLDLDLAIRQGRYLWFDALEMMDGLAGAGRADEDRFWRDGLPLMLRAARAGVGGYPRVAAGGEGTDLLLQNGLLDAAVRLEQLWDELAGLFGTPVLCTFSMPAELAANTSAHPMRLVHAQFEA